MASIALFLFGHEIVSLVLGGGDDEVQAMGDVTSYPMGFVPMLDEVGVPEHEGDE